MPADLIADPVDPTPPLPAPAATQTKYPWRATLRTLVQAALGLATALPLIVGAADIDATAPIVAGVMSATAGFARVMALPQVEALLQQFVPWLAAKPAPS